MPTTAPTSAPAPQLAAAARIVERDDGSLQVGIRPETAVRVRGTGTLRAALEAIAHGKRDTRSPELLAALDGSGLFTTGSTPGPFPVRVVGSLGTDPDPVLASADLIPRPRARLALVLSVGEVDRGVVDALIRADVPHVIVRALDGVVLLGPFVSPGSTACVRCLEAHHGDEDPGYPIALERYISAGALPRADGCLDTPDPGNTALALAWAARDLRTYSTGGIPSTWSSTVVLGGLAEPISAVAWQPHPQCGCRWYPPALGA
ncbi:MAG: hypothetical protein ACTHOG_01850 [Marmoricola sp.]